MVGRAWALFLALREERKLSNTRILPRPKPQPMPELHEHKQGTHEHRDGDRKHRHNPHNGKTYFKNEFRSDGMPVKCEGHSSVDLDISDDWAYRP